MHFLRNGNQFLKANNKINAENMEATQRVAEKTYLKNDITEIVIGCAIKVHKVLGPGLLEILTLRFSAKKLSELCGNFFYI